MYVALFFNLNKCVKTFSITPHLSEQSLPITTKPHLSSKKEHMSLHLTNAMSTMWSSYIKVWDYLHLVEILLSNLNYLFLTVLGWRYMFNTNKNNLFSYVFQNKFLITSWLQREQLQERLQGLHRYNRNNPFLLRVLTILFKYSYLGWNRFRIQINIFKTYSIRMFQ